MDKHVALRQEKLIDRLLEFVLAEIGRAADKHLDQTLPVVLYFPTDKDRVNFIEVMKQAHPDFTTRKVP